jgi:hypothetical protein
VPLPVSDLVRGCVAFALPILLVQVMELSDLGPQAHDFFLKDCQMIHMFRIYQLPRGRAGNESGTGRS